MNELELQIKNIHDRLTATGFHQDAQAVYDLYARSKDLEFERDKLVGCCVGHDSELDQWWSWQGYMRIDWHKTREEAVAAVRREAGLPE